MSTTPPRKYGYTLPTRKGKDMQEPQEGDLVWLQGRWQPTGNVKTGQFADTFYCRPIDVGPEHELVGEEEIPPKDCQAQGYEFYNSTLEKWCPFGNASQMTVKHWFTLGFSPDLCAVRCRRKSEQEQWPKYIFDAQLGKYFKLDNQSAFDHFMANFGEAPIKCSKEDYDKSILEKGGAVEPDAPRWIPVTERLPSDNTFRPVVIKNWTRIGVASWSMGRWIMCEPEKNPGEVTHWLDIPQLPQPPVVKTQQELDEEWVNQQFSLSTIEPRCECEVKEQMRKALAYARKEKE